jgi:hypothetical protein
MIFKFLKKREFYENNIIILDKFTKFFNFLIFEGYADKKYGALLNVNCLTKANVLNKELKIKGTVSNSYFRTKLLIDSEDLPRDFSLEFVFREKSVVRDVRKLSEQKMLMYPNLFNDFKELLLKEKKKTLLDVGGRDRSGYDYSTLFSSEMKVTVLDILKSKNVDVVCDAHKMSSKVQHDFDAVMSLHTFEHLAMPWKVALEMNKVLKVGGLGYVATHQSLGMHDLPWDFWRFSQFSWDFLFNEKTGFEIIKVNASHPNHILTFTYGDHKLHEEKSAGFEVSEVIFRKISDSKLTWGVDIEDCTRTFYPKN